MTTPAHDLELGRLDAFFSDQQVIWQDVSRRWIEFRKLDGPQPVPTPGPDITT